jgi:hypothetical protein
MMMKCPMQPIIDKFGRTDVPHQHLIQALLVEEWKITVSKIRHVMDGGGDIYLQQNIIVPMILAINLGKLNALVLDACVFGNGMHPTDSQKELCNQITQCHNGQHVKTPVIRVILSTQDSVGKGCQQDIFVIAKIFPWKFVQQTRFGCHFWK